MTIGILGRAYYGSYGRRVNDGSHGHQACNGPNGCRAADRGQAGEASLGNTAIVSDLHSYETTTTCHTHQGIVDINAVRACTLRSLCAYEAQYRRRPVLHHLY